MAEYLEINGLALNDTEQFWVPDLSALRATPERRGAIEPMPYVAGGIAYTHRTTVSELTLPLIIAGTSWADQEANELTVRTTVVGDDEVLPVPAVWHRNSGASWTTDVVVLGLFDPQFLGMSGGPLMRFNLAMRLPTPFAPA